MRDDWNTYFFNIAETVASRSTCCRRKVGAVAVDGSNRVIGTGYNGAPSGFENCTPDTCIRTKTGIPSGEMLDMCRAVHAEVNLVLTCADRLKGGTVYCTTQPCINCLKMLISSNVKKICWFSSYLVNTVAKELMSEFGTISEETLSNGKKFTQLISHRCS